MIEAAVIESGKRDRRLVQSHGGVPLGPHAMALLRQRPESPFGIHRALVRDAPHYR